MTGTMPRIPLDRRLALLIAWVALPSASKSTLARAFDISGMSVALATADLTREGLVENLRRLEENWRVRAKDFTASGWARALFRAIGAAAIAVNDGAPVAKPHDSPDFLQYVEDDETCFSELDALPIEEARSLVTSWVQDQDIEAYLDMLNRLVAFANFETKALQALAAFDHPKKRKAA